MKKLKYIGAMMLMALLGFSSCSSESEGTGGTQAKSRKVSLTISQPGQSQTRAAAEPTNLGGFDREKAIDGTKLYAVVFDEQGKFSKTYPITDYDADDGSCSFTLDKAGVYYGYIVANTSKGTELQALTEGSDTEDAFYNILEDTDPGADLDASTNFLMVSKRTLFDVDGDADTDLGQIDLTRAVARIDIDVTAINGLAITQVEVENRYKKSLIVRGGSPDDSGLAAATPTDTKTYVRGTASGEIDAKNDATGIVADQQWQGVIYCYENIDANTVVKITHTLNGVASTTVVNFADINSGQAIKRNNIYTVRLTNEVLSPTLKNIVANITVLDWDNSTNLNFLELTDHEKPDFKVTSSHGTFNFTDYTNKLNPGKIIASKKDSPTEITLQVTSHGRVASGVSFVNKNGNAYDFAGANGEIVQEGATTYGTDGSIIQNFKITIPQDVVTALSVSDYLTFKVHNYFDDTDVGCREFVVSPVDVKMNPLYYMAESNVLSYNSSTKMVTFEPNPQSYGSNICYSWSYAMTNFGANHTSTAYEGYKEGDVTDADGNKYHLPSNWEGLSITPVPKNEVNGVIQKYPAASTDAAPIFTETKCAFGADEVTKAGIQGKSYWGPLGTTVRYAIRFLGTGYCSAWKYENNGGNWTFSSRIIDQLEVDDIAGIKQVFNEISTAGDDFWASNEDVGAVKRYVYRSKYVSNGGNAGVGTTDLSSYYHWTTSSAGRSMIYYGCIYDYGSSQAHGFTIRLWKN